MAIILVLGVFVLVGLAMEVEVTVSVGKSMGICVSG
jgi:hypothetical protein